MGCLWPGVYSKLPHSGMTSPPIVSASGNRPPVVPSNLVNAEAPISVCETICTNDAHNVQVPHQGVNTCLVRFQATSHRAYTG
eukprot:5912171-Amphidinium_carterae.1